MGWIGAFNTNEMINDKKLFRGTGLITRSVVEKDTFLTCFTSRMQDLFLSASLSASEAPALGPGQAPAEWADLVNAPQYRSVKVSHQDLPFLQQRLLIPKMGYHSYS